MYHMENTNNALTASQALEILAQAAAQFKGTRSDHELLEKAVRTLAPLVAPAKDAALGGQG